MSLQFYETQFAELTEDSAKQEDLIKCIKGAFGVKESGGEGGFGYRYGSGYGRRTHTPLPGGGRMVNRRPAPRRRRMY